MPLNKSQGNMYEFVTHTWNTVKGECPHGCTYCYMKRWGKQKPVRFDEKELRTDLGEGNFIFVGSSCDMFADNIPDGWIDQTLLHCADFRNNHYLFQSKNPQVMNKWIFPARTLVCTTIETNREYPGIMKYSPKPETRALYLSRLSYPKYVTIEPIMDFDLYPMLGLIKGIRPEQVNIGADSGNNNLPEPPFEKVKELISELEKFTTISKKKNLERLNQY